MVPPALGASRLLAIAGVIAIAVTAVIFALTGAYQATSSNAASADAQSHSYTTHVTSVGTAGEFRDPATNLCWVPSPLKTLDAVKNPTGSGSVHSTRSSEPTLRSVLMV